MTAIEDLKALIPSPSVQPARVASWPWYEDHAGIRFPTDYKAIVDSYGSGVFCDDVIVWTPVPWPGGQTILDLQHEQQDLLDIVVAQASAHDTQWAFNDGVSVTTDVLATELFAWGNSSGGEYGYWHMNSSDPDQWAVLVTDGMDRIDYHKGGLAQYLLDLWNGGFPNRHLLRPELYDLPHGPYFQTPDPDDFAASVETSDE